MPLTAVEVTAFIQAPKRVPAESFRAIHWIATGPDVVRWIGPVEYAGALPSRIVLVVNRSAERHWNLQVDFERESICAWHLRPGVNHKNRGCPRQFPGRVKGPHEHLWIEGVRWECALPLLGIGGLSHEQALRAFCQRMNIVFEPIYFPPPAGEQITLYPGGTGS